MKGTMKRKSKEVIKEDLDEYDEEVGDAWEPRVLPSEETNTGDNHDH